MVIILMPYNLILALTKSFVKVSSVTYRLVPPLALRLIAGAASPFYHLLTGSRCVHYSGKNIIAASQVSISIIGSWSSSIWYILYYSRTIFVREQYACPRIVSYPPKPKFRSMYIFFSYLVASNSMSRCSSNVHASMPAFLAIRAKYRYIFARSNEPCADLSE